MLTFKPFHHWAVENKLKKTALRSDCGFGNKTAAKIWGDQFPVRSDIIEKLCQVYGLRIDQVLAYIPDEIRIDENKGAQN